MKVLFHMTAQSGYAGRFLNTVFSMIADRHVNITFDIAEFREALIKYRIDMPIVVILVSSIEDVAAIKHLSDLLDDLFLIIVTDSNHSSIIAGCRKLYPRFLGRTDHDLEVVAAVIEKRLAILKASSWAVQEQNYRL